AGLFAATVAAFLIASYPSLSPPDKQDQTNALLAQLVSLANATPVTTVTIPDSDVPRSAVIVNTLWFIALVLSLLCALLATLIQDWTTGFLRAQRPWVYTTIKQHAINVMNIQIGVRAYRLHQMVPLNLALMHSSVILFILGLVVFTYNIDTTPAIALATLGGISALLYICATAI
ncbi:hypothetical protein PENSPDRAFT_561505, partial [Peniophora sp. CONT]